MVDRVDLTHNNVGLHGKTSCLRNVSGVKKKVAALIKHQHFLRHDLFFEEYFMPMQCVFSRSLSKMLLIS